MINKIINYLFETIFLRLGVINLYLWSPPFSGYYCWFILFAVQMSDRRGGKIKVFIFYYHSFWEIDLNLSEIFQREFNDAVTQVEYTVHYALTQKKLYGLKWADTCPWYVYDLFLKIYDKTGWLFKMQTKKHNLG